MATALEQVREALNNARPGDVSEVHMTELGKHNNGLVKYLEEVKRRVRSGKCFHRPALGVREFAADVDLEEDAQAALERPASEWQHD